MTSLDEGALSRVLDVRTELGIRRAVDGTGADVGRVLDSQSVLEAVGAIDAQAMDDYDTAVADAVRGVIDGDAARFGVAPAQPANQGPRQWTLEDVERSTPAELEKAMNAGLLRDMGVGPSRRRRGYR